MKALAAFAALASCGGCAAYPDNTATRFELVGASSEQRAAVDGALAAWAQAAGVTAAIGEPHDARIEIVDDMPGLRGLTDFEALTIYLEPGPNFRRVTLHELGHWFSWSPEHSPDPADVMYLYARADALTAADVARVR